MDIVITEGLRKSYGHVEVLHGVDLSVPRGSLYGFLGPNGAGKTTTIRVLLGLLKASAGAARVEGMDCWSAGPEVRRCIGYLPGDIRLYPHMKARDLLRFLDRARGTSSGREIDLGKRVRQCSRGMKQKIGLIQALMHRPKLLVLDEPTISLDPLMRDVLLAELRRVAGEGRTVLFSSHTLSEVEQLCDRVAILRDGRVIEQERIEALRSRAVRRVEVVFADRADCPADAPTGLRVASREDNVLKGAWTGPMDPLLVWLAGNRVTDVSIAPPDLEDLFLAYYSDREGGRPQ